MATKQFIIKKGEPASEEIVRIIETTFSNAELEKACERGARLRISLTAPWPKVPKKKMPKVVINDSLIENIKEAAQSEEELESALAELSGPQIQEIGTRLGISVSKSGRVESKRAQLHNSLRSGEIWRGISGQGSAKERKEKKENKQSD